MLTLPTPPESAIQALVSCALSEDIGQGDLTAGLIDNNNEATARLVCKEHAILCGVPWFEEACRQVDSKLQVEWFYAEGEKMESGAEVCLITGRARAILTVERTAINLLQTLSGTATVTARYAGVIAGTNTQILDTRKTIPGMRLAQKYAVSVGGGKNHRIGLFDGILIKENHIAAAGSIKHAVARAREAIKDAPHCQLLEVEVESLDQLKEAIAAGVTRIMLDNFDLADMERAVVINQDLTGGTTELEVSGNVELDGLRAIAQTGVDYVSIGALTKHIQATDFSLRMVE